MLPLSLQYGHGIMSRFLAGAHSVDAHFMSAPPAHNLPVLMGLLGVWNSTFLGHGSRALLPYSQALLRFPAHIQQVDSESASGTHSHPFAPSSPCSPPSLAAARAAVCSGVERQARHRRG